MSLTKPEHDELCCVYAALLLHDDKVEITADKINKVIAASGNSVEGYYPEFFAKYFQSVNLDSMLQNIGTAPAVTAEPVVVEETAKDNKKDDKKGGKDDKKGGKGDDKKGGKGDDKKGKGAEKKEEKKEEENEDEGFGLGGFEGMF